MGDHPHIPGRWFQLNPEESSRSGAIRTLRQRLELTTVPLEQLLVSAQLCAWEDVEPFRSWPSTIDQPAAAELPQALRSICFQLIGRLRSERGEKLAEALSDSQNINTLLQADREHGSLLQEVHDDLEGVIHECSSLLLDDEASICITELVQSLKLDLLPTKWVLGIVRHPLGETQRLELARVATLSDQPVRPICAVPVFEGELVFDGGRPSLRMMDSFQNRQGLILCSDGTKVGVRAVLEADWRVSVEFDADQQWCDRIDGIRLGALPTQSLDEQRDTWVASLATYGLDTQTKMVGQPILISLSTGERFSM